MADVVLPIDLIPNAVEWRLIDNSGVFSSPLSGTVRRVSRPGNRWGARLTYNNINAAKRHRLMALLSSLRGRVNSIYVPDLSTVQRGSMSAPELFNNADFVNGAAGWSILGGTLTAISGGLRFAQLLSLNEIDLYQAMASLSTSLPYCLRVIFNDGMGTAGAGIGPAIDGGNYNNYSTSLRGYQFVAAAPSNASGNQYAAVLLSNSAILAGSFFDLTFASMARCLQVDNGPNALTYSDQLDNGAWSRVALTGVTADVAQAPDGTNTADAIVEDSATAAHYITQTASGTTSYGDYYTAGFFKRGSGTRNVRLVVGSTGAGNYGEAYFDLGAGTFSNVGVGGTAVNARAYIQSYGFNWYYCCIVARFPAGVTNSPIVQLASGTTGSYAGNGTSSLYAWRVGSGRSESPPRPSQTTSAALATGVVQSGSALYVRGGPASTAGALLAGDMVEITEGRVKTATGSSQLVRLTADFDTNAVGGGLLRFEPPIRNAPTDGAAVIVQKPLCKMLLANGEVGWETRPGLFSDFVLDLVEDVA